MKQAARSRASLSRNAGPRLTGKIRTLWADRRGVAAVEFGIFSIFLAAALANVTDVSIYVYQRMQAENARSSS